MSSLEIQTAIATPADTTNMDLTPTLTREKQVEVFHADVEDGEESNPPLLQPDPCRLMSCLRAPCLKKQNAEWTSGSTSPIGSITPPSSLPVYAMIGIKTLCSAPLKRQVHFDAAPPEAGFTHSGDRYDRRPIECTQGGSQLDLSLPPRGTCTLSDEAGDEAACEDEDDDEESKQKRLQGFAKWARLKNGASSWMGASSSLKSILASGKRGDEVVAAASQELNSCSTPIHGIRSFGKLAGQSGLSSPELSPPRSQQQEQEDYFTSDGDISEAIAVASGDEDSESEDRHEAFRKAVFAALSKDPNATPMPSPSVRPRWECVTSYFEPPNEATKAEEEAPFTVEVGKSSISKDNEILSSGLPLSKEQEASKVANWTQDQAKNGEESSIPIKSVFGLTLPPPKSSPSLSIEESSSLTNRSSSPMSSRCSSSDAWGSESGGEHWSGSEFDAFDAAFSKGASVSTSLPMNSRSDLEKEPITPSSPSRNNTTPRAENVPTLAQGSPLCSQDSEPHDTEHTSSSSSGGGAGWMSSCCTSPEMAALDGDHQTASSTNDKSIIGIKMNSLRNVVPLFLERRHSSDGKIEIDESPIRRSSQRLYQLTTDKDVVSMSEGNTPHVLSCDEDEANHSTSPKSLRCPIKKMKKARRTASGDGRRDDVLSERGLKPAMLSRSKSTTSSHKKASAFQSDFDDEGALGGF